MATPPLISTDTNIYEVMNSISQKTKIDALESVPLHENQETWPTVIPNESQVHNYQIDLVRLHQVPKVQVQPPETARGQDTPPVIYCVV